MSRPRAADAAIAVGVAVLMVSACALVALALMRGRAAVTPSSPGFASISDLAAGEGGQVDRDGFPVVDWAWWQAENPDVVGWVTVPGTSIDHPVCQAPAHDPDYYLDHDAHRCWNPYGAVYLDAECAEGGLMGSANAVVLGHHMDDGSMLAPLASYADAGWAQAHRVVLLQTPDAKERFEVVAVDVVDAAAEAKRTRFAGARDYRDWWRDAVGGADVVLDAGAAPEHACTLATCSYSAWADERTLVYAAPAEGRGV